MSDEGTSHFITAPDGLKLHARGYGTHSQHSPPVVCLPGLARTATDFHRLANSLAHSAKRPRYVLALDYRGRGLSEYDRDARNYNLSVELADVLAVLTAMGIGPAIIVGTSRGGILAMLLATVRPTAIAGVVLNDIGPVIESKGLVRIKSYVGRMPQPRDFEDGAEILRRLFDAQFPKLAHSDWIALSHRTFREENGRLLPCYDVQLSRVLADIHPESAPPQLWKEFDALESVPLMVIRGANSDVLSARTVSKMLASRPDIDALEVADQGHAPLLMESDVISRIEAFVARC
jgi:pimeloyl-ACP methyl ester carboxylesterase